VSIASALWLNWIAHRRRSTHVVLLRGASVVAWFLSMRVVMFLLNMMDFLHDLFTAIILGTVFLISLFILGCFDAVDDRSDGANNAQDGNDQADKRVTLPWVRLINGVLVIAVATIVKVVSIAIVIDKQEVRGIISASIEIVRCPIVNVEWSRGTCFTDTIIRIRVRCRVCISTVRILIIVCGSVVFVIPGGISR